MLPLHTAQTPRHSPPTKTCRRLTRSGGAVANLTLREVKKVYIEMRGDAAFNELRSNLVESLGSSGVVTAATNADEADASLKIVVSQTRAGDIQASARLVNARGTVLWPKAGRGARRYSGETTKVVSEIVKDLLSEIRLAPRALSAGSPLKVQFLCNVPSVAYFGSPWSTKPAQ